MIDPEAQLCISMAGKVCDMVFPGPASTYRNPFCLTGAPWSPSFVPSVYFQLPLIALLLGSAAPAPEIQCCVFTSSHSFHLCCVLRPPHVCFPYGYCLHVCMCFFISDCIGVVMLLIIHCFCLAFWALLASFSHSCTINTCSSGMSLVVTLQHVGTWPQQVLPAF